jgi:hypothetical protein
MCKSKILHRRHEAISDRHLRAAKKEVRMRTLFQKLGLERRRSRLRPSLSKAMTQRRMLRKIMMMKSKENQGQI